MGGITFKFFPLAEGRSVRRLAVYLHGDTAAEWFQDWMFPDVVKWATPRSILVIAPLSPVGYTEGDHSYGAAQPSEAQTVGGAIEEFIAAYRTRSDDLLFWSTSGGSWFITSSFLPGIGGRIQGRFALSCGGSEFWNPWLWDVTDVETRSRIHVLLNYGSLDFLVPGEDASYTELQRLGFDVSRIVYDGKEHCRHDVVPPTLEFWQAPPL